MRRIKRYGGKQQTLPIKDPKLVTRIMDYWRFLIDHAATDKMRNRSYRNYMLFLIGFNTAFRAEDLLQLKVRHVIKGYVSIKENKTGKMQHFRMNKKLHEEILTYINYFSLKENDYLFMGQKTKTTHDGVTTPVIYPITRQNCDSSIFPKIIKAFNIDFNFSLHSLRKTFGYMYVLNGGNPLTLMKMLNHDSLETTMLYIMWNTEDAEKDRESIYIGGIRSD